MRNNHLEHHRGNMNEAVQRDFSRHHRREDTHRTFWRSLGVLGMVGWPIAIASAGGALLGHYLDIHLGTGVRFTLMLLTAGALIGSYTAWRIIRDLQ
jgi:predicted F0F1-ATPase subunit